MRRAVIRSTPPLLALGALLLAPFGAARAQARWHEPLSTGGAHLVVVTSTAFQGLEEGIPPGSAYARGITLDSESRWEEALEAYRTARSEFEELVRKHPQMARQVRGWLLKVEWQAEQSARLRRATYYLNFPQFSSGYGAYLYPYQVVAKHNKWLAIRAFTGQAPKKLEAEILDEYQKIIKHQAHADSARIALASFYHETGRHREGRQTFASVRAPDRTDLAKDVAYYHATAGEVDQSLERLEAAIRHQSSTRRFALMSNDFDRLRGDPRFRRLVGEP